MAEGREGFEENRTRALSRALAAMGAVAVLIGLVLGGAVVAMFQMTGVGEARASAEAAPATVHIPRYRPTKQVEDTWPALKGYTPSPTPRIEIPREDPAPETGITLNVSPQEASPGQQINFTGVYAGAEGAVLQVQRDEDGAWADFPVTARVQGGSFRTWILTTRIGESRFRVVDTETGRASNQVIVDVG